MIARAWVVSLMLVSVSALAKKPDPARELYQKGIVHYDLAEYDLAIDAFKQAYALSNEPGLLFNLAQTYRLKKDHAQALHFYETFLGLRPATPNRADVEAQIVKMREALAAEEAERQRQAAETPPPPPPQPVVVVAPPPPPPPKFTSTARGRATIALAAIGGFALVTAAGTGGVALAERSRYDAGCAAGACDPSLFTGGQRLAIATDVLIGVGAALAITSVVLVLTRPRTPRPVQLGMAF
jgi:tetratricopeptide (TPR) repeat protein